MTGPSWPPWLPGGHPITQQELATDVAHSAASLREEATRQLALASVYSNAMQQIGKLAAELRSKEHALALENRDRISGYRQAFHHQVEAILATAEAAEATLLDRDDDQDQEDQ